MKRKFFVTLLAVSLILGMAQMVNASDTQEVVEQQGEWVNTGNRWWYCNADGSYPAKCWQYIDHNWYYFDSMGYRVTGWQKLSGSWYLLNQSGQMLTGWQKTGGKWYYMNSSGQMKTGWVYSGGKWYYLGGSGAMLTDWQKVDGYWYYMNSNGEMLTGWQKVNGYWYYMNSNGEMLTGWQKIGGVWYYMNSSGEMVTGKYVINGSSYYFNSSGVLAETDVSDLLKNAVKPLGETLYVWGGGWNQEDTAAGETALFTGVWPQWKEYYQNNKKEYSYIPGQKSWNNGNREWRFYGLDCSGYLGWIMFNSVNGGKNYKGYVVKASKFSSSLEEYGYGNAVSCTPNSKFYPGDIVSIQGHCFLCLGQCKDGSVLILHSTPNGGVQMSGTVNGSSSSLASKLAQEFMKQYYPEWWDCFGKEGRQSVNAGQYLNRTKFSWKISGSVSDTDRLRSKMAEDILDYIKMDFSY